MRTEQQLHTSTNGPLHKWDLHVWKPSSKFGMCHQEQTAMPRTGAQRSHDVWGMVPHSYCFGTHIIQGCFPTHPTLQHMFVRPGWGKAHHECCCFQQGLKYAVHVATCQLL
eukprot:CAMPEP_0174307352 /NCGR_PEP_ID=MMETSP0810-20121108/1062_1 /TAXON_ID=73025 ORGANISM="Eutreptiella gymnastica-like, Strain CCMP1594" /NCGR_SAMPLE_ID=MMETSP0810 /ASSEMBLY_ACC=CAM_ASM_000659 /LENGTH=110 /DNA_ID=CAMNT_0015414375 /DNA_START=856 /DNA_END=1188 /DNA_ORIENTATION=+